jgi:hypothetical protein
VRGNIREREGQRTQSVMQEQQDGLKREGAAEKLTLDSSAEKASIGRTIWVRYLHVDYARVATVQQPSAVEDGASPSKACNSAEREAIVDRRLGLDRLVEDHGYT